MLGPRREFVAKRVACVVSTAACRPVVFVLTLCAWMVPVIQMVACTSAAQIRTDERQDTRRAGEALQAREPAGLAGEDGHAVELVGERLRRFVGCLGVATNAEVFVTSERSSSLRDARAETLRGACMGTRTPSLSLTLYRAGIVRMRDGPLIKLLVQDDGGYACLFANVELDVAANSDDEAFAARRFTKYCIMRPWR